MKRNVIINSAKFCDGTKSHKTELQSRTSTILIVLEIKSVTVFRPIVRRAKVNANLSKNS
ncbi:MAG: hypothetical protein LBP59_08020 [Planctomycetaceae bacterium]|nr:hypothetical protein [Planctomycetaceae bacterium]